MSERIRVKEFDIGLLCMVLIISIFGIFTIFSAAHSGTRSDDRLWLAQVIRLVIALIAMSVVVIIDYRVLHSLSYILYTLGFLLLLVLLFFPEQSGARRWFMRGAIQPSELARLILIITLARYLSDKRRVSGQLRVFITAMIIVLAYTFLIFMQPSLGYALILIPIALLMLYVGGIN